MIAYYFYLRIIDIDLRGISRMNLSPAIDRALKTYSDSQLEKVTLMGGWKICFI